MAKYDYIKTEIKGRTKYITLNRPEKRNAFHPDLIIELKDAFGRAARNEDCRVIVLKANGPAFSAGADLSYLQELQQNSFDENLADSTILMELFRDIYFHPKPIIAQVEGHAIAGGCGLATVCDFVFTVPEAKFGYTEVKIGFVPAIVMFFLLRKIGEAKARELLLTGDLVSAEKMQELGLVKEIVAPEEIAGRVEDFCENLAKTTSEDSIAITRKMIAEIQHLEAQEALLYAARSNAAARETEDCHRGISAFLKREKIEW